MTRYSDEGDVRDIARALRRRKLLFVGVPILFMAIAWAVAEVSPKKIDEINILWASVLAMHRAVDLLKTRPDFLLIDGNRFKKYADLPHLTVVKGDSIYASIAAASVLAKTYRDDRMAALDGDFPQYSWKKNKGYPAKAHRDGIREFGATEHHRK